MVDITIVIGVWFMVDITIVNGVYKPTYTVAGGHHPAPTSLNSINP